MNISLPLNGLIRDIHNGLKASLHSKDCDMGNYSTPYPLENTISMLYPDMDMNIAYGQFMFDFGYGIFGSMASMADPRIPSLLMDFSSWAMGRGHHVFLSCNEMGVQQGYTLSYISDMQEGSFNALHGIDFCVSPSMAHRYDMVFTEDHRLLGLPNAVGLETEYTVGAVKDFEDIKRHIEENGG